MKRICFGILLLFIISLYAQAVDYVGPDFAQGFYDQYSKNYLNADMVGRGHTGMALPGGVDYAHHNPAAMLDDYSSMILEIAIKARVDEFNDLQNNKYQSNSPLNSIGFSFAPFNNTHFGFSYNLENSLEYNSFERPLPQTDTSVDYKPKYANNQILLSFAHELNKHISFGVNGIVNVHSFREYRNEGKVDLISFNKAYYRIQPGLLYQSEFVNLGASFVHAVDVNYKHKYIDYNMTIPAELKAGIAIKFNNDLIVLADTDFTLYSQQAKYMNDQAVFKLGIEKRFENPFIKIGDYSLKLGFIYSPKIYSGEYNVPNYSSDSLDEFHPNFYNAIPDIGFIKPVDLRLLTIGTTVRIKNDVQLNMGYILDTSKDVGLNQLVVSLKFDLAVFNSLKKNLP
ncbi:MAG: hypothetical protein LHW49_08860 [Candidatus Cloacimonetes bacterium]|nr:hypothetical protein [Candidatus Cloacimonadota bacterium]